MSSNSPLQSPEDMPIINKPEILKSWKPKLFVLLLCMVSFYAGWQASRSYLVKECHALGAQVSFEDKTVLCKR